LGLILCGAIIIFEKKKSAAQPRKATKIGSNRKGGKGEGPRDSK